MGEGGEGAAQPGERMERVPGAWADTLGQRGRAPAAAFATALHCAVCLACELGDEEMLAELLARFGGDFEPNRRTSYAERAELLERGGMPRAAVRGGSAVHHAVSRGGLGVLKILAATPGVALEGIRDEYGFTPFLRAVASGGPPVVEFLAREPSVDVGAWTLAHI